MHSIVWPDNLRPGFCDNFASNEIIVSGLTAEAVWATLIDTSTWAAQYDNATDIVFHEDDGPILKADTKFQFVTFGFPVEATVLEYQPPSGDEPARIAWHGWATDDADQRMDVHHAWLFEDLPDNRVRILTQETQNGAPAMDMAKTRPNPMINAHQDWIEGLARVAVGD